MTPDFRRWNVSIICRAGSPILLQPLLSFHSFSEKDVLSRRLSRQEDTSNAELGFNRQRTPDFPEARGESSHGPICQRNSRIHHTGAAPTQLMISKTKMGRIAFRPPSTRDCNHRLCSSSCRKGARCGGFHWGAEPQTNATLAQEPFASPRMRAA